MANPPEVHGVLCFTRAELPLVRTLRMRGHLLLYRKAVARRLRREGPASPAEVGAVARALAVAFPAA